MSVNKKLVVGNWKMNGTRESACSLVNSILVGDQNGKADIVICPPAILLSAVGELLAGSPIALGAQDCHPEPRGAFTGDIAAEMLADFGVTHVIVGHSERRAQHGESNELVAAKASAALQAGLTPIICVGESEEVRRAGNADQFVAGQLKESLPQDIQANLVIAYEPLWAIGTGKTCEPIDIAAMHAMIKATLGRGLENSRVIYGGSVKAENATEILAAPHVDGVLPGGASLDAAAFTAIVAAAAKIG